jgi:hypothetical protein
MAAAAIPSIITTVDGRQHERITKKISNKRAALLLLSCIGRYPLAVIKVNLS